MSIVDLKQVEIKSAKFYLNSQNSVWITNNPKVGWFCELQDGTLGNFNEIPQDSDFFNNPNNNTHFLKRGRKKPVLFKLSEIKNLYYVIGGLRLSPRQQFLSGIYQDKIFAINAEGNKVNAVKGQTVNEVCRSLYRLNNTKIINGLKINTTGKIPVGFMFSEKTFGFPITTR